MLKQKRGAELSFNIIIIVIILVIVLVIVAAFFTGSFTKLVEQITRAGPDNLQNSLSECRSSCQLAQTYETENQKSKSRYCRANWHFDVDDDGNLEKDGDDLREYHCWEFPIEESCPGVENECPRA